MKALLIFFIFCSFYVFAGKGELDIFQNGKKIIFNNLPFDYLPQKDGDRKVLLIESEYLSLDINEENKNIVLVIGPLRPCVAFIFYHPTKIVAFHYTLQSDNSSFHEIFQAEFANVDKNEIHARIYTTQDDVIWKRQFSIEHSSMLSNKKQFVVNTLGLPNNNVYCARFNLRDKNNKSIHGSSKLGYYFMTELFVAIRMDESLLEEITSKNGVTKRQIRLFSFSPVGDHVENLPNKESLSFPEENIQQYLIREKILAVRHKITAEQTRRYRIYHNDVNLTLEQLPLINPGPVKFMQAELRYMD